MVVPTAGFWSDGFDAYNGAGGVGSGSFGLQGVWNGPTFLNGASMVGGRFGGQAVSMGNNNRMYRATSVGSVSAFAIGCAFNWTGQANTRFVAGMTIGANGPIQMGVAVNSLGQLLAAYGGSYSVLGGPSSAAIVANTWRYIEIAGTLAGSSSSFDIYLDGTNVLSGTGVNPGGSTGADTVMIADQNNSITGFTYDDVYFNPAHAALGPIRCAMLRPIANSAVAWTPDSGSNWQRVGETLIDDDTSYVSANVAGASDLYGMSGLPTTPLQIFGATAIMVARTTDANPRKARIQLKSGATLEQGSDIVIGSNTYSWNTRVDLTDPNTGLAWTPAAIGALLGGPYLSA